MTSERPSRLTRSSKLKELRKILQDKVTAYHTLPDAFHFDYKMSELSPSHADRAAALMAATVLEHALEAAILTHLAPDEGNHASLFQGDGQPLLTSTWAKTELGYALGIFGPQTKEDLGCIRSIRNTFAHSRLAVSFSTPGIEAACGLLHIPQKPIWHKYLPQPVTAKEKFIETIKVISIFLFGDPTRGPIRYQGSYWENVMD